MEEKKQIQIAIPNEAKPSFSNATQITVNDDAVTMQFAYVRPNTEQGQLMSEVILTPKHAMDFQKALDTTLKKHFTKHLDENE
ncbi:DUF3467 domain-containing protein [Candidatus Wolfebacteria bacterium]|nr:DUF3467 domain-containing protein [Candidatus Wolfebacteria bacterium]